MARVERRLIEIPYEPRPQFLAYHNRVQRFAKTVAHRRFGKTVGSINDKVKKALENPRRDPPPRYGYIAPTYTQAKDIAWVYLKHYTAPIPGIQISESELWVQLPNAARIRLYGADNYDRMRGLYFDGVTVDEPAKMDPRAWPTVIRPTLSDYNGWASFIGTPEGRNWFYHLGRNPEDGGLDMEWQHLTFRASETGLLPESELASARSMLTPEQYAQEYECSFEAAVVGSYYGKLMAAAEEDKRITGVPYEPQLRVWTAWDIGKRDATSIWFAQVVGREIRLIDYYEMTGVGADHYAKVVLEKPYIYEGHILPHDVKVEEWGSGKSRYETLESLKLKNINVAPNIGVEDGINAVRMILPRCLFDAKKCLRGIDALKLYRSEYDEKLKALRPRPVHDWASHAADAFRYLAVTLDTSTADVGFGRKIAYSNAGVA